MVMTPLSQPITPELLTLVDAIARHGSFAKAAREQGKVPSAVTYAIRKLEDGLDVLLFDRSGQRARLTPAGEALLRKAATSCNRSTTWPAASSGSPRAGRWSCASPSAPCCPGARCMT